MTGPPVPPAGIRNITNLQLGRFWKGQWQESPGKCILSCIFTIQESSRKTENLCCYFKKQKLNYRYIFIKTCQKMFLNSPNFKWNFRVTSTSLMVYPVFSKYQNWFICDNILYSQHLPADLLLDKQIILKFPCPNFMIFFTCTCSLPTNNQATMATLTGKSLVFHKLLIDTHLLTYR